MDKQSKYQQIIEKTLSEVYLLLQNDKEFEAILAINHTRGQYILKFGEYFVY
jgi:hypothetical protein